MEPAVEPRRRRLLISLIAGGLALLTLIGVGVYGLLRGPADATGTTDAPPVAATSTPTDAPKVGAGPVKVTQLAKPEEFARAVATALFTWDTTSGYGPADFAQPISDVASTAEADALASDVRAYLPTTQAWTHLRPYQTRQWLTINTITVPRAWETALAQAAPGQIPAGTTAYTITGTRHRAGTWGTTPTDAKRSVAFTVFVTCTHPVPDRPGAVMCSLLRLGELDNPLR
jgi:hypothetical protein